MTAPLDLDAIDLNTIREYCAKATRGPWVINESGELKTAAGRLVTIGWKPEYARQEVINEYLGMIYAEVVSGGYTGRVTEGMANREFVVCARTDLPRCLVVIEALREALKKAANYVDAVRWGWPMRPNDPAHVEVQSEVAAALALVKGSSCRA